MATVTAEILDDGRVRAELSTDHWSALNLHHSAVVLASHGDLSKLAEAIRALRVGSLDEQASLGLAYNAAFQSLWRAFGETLAERDAASLVLEEIAAKSTDESARRLAREALARVGGVP